MKRRSKYILTKIKNGTKYNYRCLSYFDALVTRWLETMKEKSNDWLRLIERKRNYRKYGREASDYRIEFVIKRL